MEALSDIQSNNLGQFNGPYVGQQAPLLHRSIVHLPVGGKMSYNGRNDAGGGGGGGGGGGHITQSTNHIQQIHRGGSSQQLGFNNVASYTKPFHRHNSSERISLNKHSVTFEDSLMLHMPPNYLVNEISLPKLTTTSINDNKLNENNLLASILVKRIPSTTNNGNDFNFTIRKFKSLNRELQENGTAIESICKSVLLELHPQSISSSTNAAAVIYPGDLLVDIDVNGLTPDDYKRIPLSSPDDISLKVHNQCKLRNEMRLLAYPMRDIRDIHVYLYRRTISLTHPFNDSRQLHWSINDPRRLAMGQEAYDSLKRFYSTERVGGEQQESSGRAWLAHRDGYTAVRIIPSKSPRRLDNNSTTTTTTMEMNDKCEVELVKTGQRLMVDSIHVDKMNPSRYDSCANVSDLAYPNESSVIHVLRQRYGQNQWFTYADRSLHSLITLHPLLPPSVRQYHTQILYGDAVTQVYAKTRSIISTPSTIGGINENGTTTTLPPHVFAMAETCLSRLQQKARESSRHNNSTGSTSGGGGGSCHPIVCLMGASGGGKSFYARQIVKYWISTLTRVSGGGGGGGAGVRVITPEHIQSMFTILDAFTCSRTLINNQASRCARLVTLDLGYGNVSSAANARQLYLHGVQVQLLLLERTRVVRRPEGEPTFHVFYYMLAGLCEEERIMLQLNHTTEPNLFMTPLSRDEEVSQAERSWLRLMKSIKQMGVSVSEWYAICRLLAVIYHLGVAGARECSTGVGAEFHNIESAQRCATLLECPLSTLQQMVFCLAIEREGGQVQWRALVGKGGSCNTTPLDLLESFVIGLYTQVVQMVMYLINRSLNSDKRQSNESGFYSLTVLDPPGFQNSASLGRRTGATYEDLSYNYVYENLLHFHQKVYYDNPKAMFQQEDIDPEWLRDVDLTSASDIIRLIEGPSDQNEMPSPSPIISSGSNGQTSKRTFVAYQNGIPRPVNQALLPLLDDAAMNGTSEENLVKQLYLLYQDHKLQHRKGEDRLMGFVNKSGQFTLTHCCNSVNVLYNPVGWLKNCREYPTAKNAESLLLHHVMKTIRELVESSRSTLRNSSNQRVTPRSAPSRPERKQLSSAGGGIIRINTNNSTTNTATTTTSQKTRSLSLQLKAQVGWLLDQLRRSSSAQAIYFIHCLLPIPNAGLSDLRGTSPMAPHGEDCSPQVAFLRQQLRAIQLLPLLRIQRDAKYIGPGFSFRDFCQRFESAGKFIASASVYDTYQRQTVLNEREATKLLLNILNVDPQHFVLGRTQVFLRPGVKEKLDVSRFSGIEKCVIHLQRLCRGFLARRKTESLWARHQAVECIQRNAAIFMQLRQWPWWNLFQSVRPLIHVHRSQADLVAAQDEAEKSRALLHQKEQENKVLKKSYADLQNEIADLKDELGRSQHDALYATDRLDSEREHSLRIQRELDETKIRYHESENARLEMEHETIRLRSSTMQLKQQQMLQQETPKNNSQDDDDDNELYKDRYLQRTHEVEMLRRQLEKEDFEHQKELEEQKTSQEIKMKTLQEENEMFAKELSAARRRQVKCQQELSDLQNRLEQEENRNGELERKQKKFDIDLNRVQVVADQEINRSEQLQRERDDAIAEKFRLEHLLQEVQTNLNISEKRSALLSQQMNSITEHFGGANGGGVGGIGGVGGGDLGAGEKSLLELKRSKMELQQKIQELEEDADTQAQLLEQMKQSKLRAEMNLEKLRQQSTKQLEERDKELEEVRSTLQRRVRQVEQLLEDSREERQSLMRDRRELDQKLSELMAKDAQRDLDKEKKLRSELKKNRSLLEEAYATIDQLRGLQPDDKSIVKQLRDQLENAEIQRDTALRQRRQLSTDVDELKAHLEDAVKSKTELEERSAALRRECDELHQQVETQEEEMSDMMHKYRTVVSQQAADSNTIAAQTREIKDLQDQREKLRQQVMEAEEKAHSQETNQVNRTEAARWETRFRELEARMDIEISSKNRIQNQLERLREQMSHVEMEREQLMSSESAHRDTIRRMQRQLRDLREEVEVLENRCLDAERRRNDAINHAEQLEEDLQASQNELRKSLRRVQDLQAIIDDNQDDSDLEPIPLASNLFSSDDEDDQDSVEAKPVLNPNNSSGPTTSTGSNIPAAAAAKVSRHDSSV